MDSQGGHVMTIANSIIGVSILAMPYCFKQCGLILSSLMLILSSIISRLSCHFLLKSSVIAKHKSIESLAFFAFGSFGKLTIELGIIGFLLGTCIAFFVVMGDLGPQIVADMVGIPATDTLRTTVLIFLAVFCILPLGLLRQVDSLTVVCTAAIGFYMCLVLKIMAESAPHLMHGDWYNQVYFWRTEGILQCLPIFSMALFCQTQLFEIYQAIPNANLERMNNMIRMAVNICTCVYIFVGTFGYIAVCDQPFTGNILLSFKSSVITEIIKIGFVLSVAVSFPLIIFPCRASLFSMTYTQAYKSLEYGRSYIPDANFRFLTVAIIAISLLIGVLIPNIELVLGLIGSTIGILICVLFPATSFICLSKKNTNERILAQVMIFIGVLVMVLGTYANLNVEVQAPNKIIVDKVEVVNPIKILDKVPVLDIKTTLKTIDLKNINDKKEIPLVQPEISNEVIHEARHEPPQPVEPEAEPVNDPNIQIPKNPEIIPEKSKEENKQTTKITSNVILEAPKEEDVLKDDKEKDNLELDSEAIKKEDKEIKLQQDEAKVEEKQFELNEVKKESDEMLEKKDEDIEEKKVQLNELQKQTVELLEKQQQLLAEINNQTKIENEVIKEIKAEKMKSIKEIKQFAKSVMDHIALDLDKTTEKNILKELVESVKDRNEAEVNPQEIIEPKPSVYAANSSENKPKAFGVPENFAPIPIAKSNLSLYNVEINKNISNQQKLEDKENKTELKVEKASLENNIVFKNKTNEKTNSLLKDLKLEQLPKEKIDNNSEKQEDQKSALESVRRDILSLNKSRMKRELKELTHEKLPNENEDNVPEKCDKTSVPPI